jgi:pimeloyl-ACP methyl ester carboxylesterase
MQSFERAGLHFDVHDYGTGERGTVVCLHGFPQDATSYDAVVPRLVDAGLRVLVPDQRGYSRGARPRDGGRAGYAMPQLVADVLALLDAAQVQRAHVVGHDWGGAVAWALAGRHAERVQSLTVLSTPHPGALAAAMRSSSQLLRSSYIGFFQLPGVPERVLLARQGWLVRELLSRSGLPAHRVGHYLERVREPGALSAMLGWYRGIAASRSHPAGRTRVPTSLVFGSRDPFFAPAAARRTRDFVLADYRLEQLDAGHWLAETHAPEVAAAVLRRVATGPG